MIKLSVNYDVSAQLPYFLNHKTSFNYTNLPSPLNCDIALKYFFDSQNNCKKSVKINKNLSKILKMLTDFL